MREQRKLAAIVAADVAGYSRLMGQDEAGTVAALKTLRREVVDPTIARHGGRIVKTTGDGLLLEFASIVDAVRCAVDVQAEMAVRNREIATDRRIAFRIGVNLGDVILDGDDILGEGVNVAARLEGISEPGGLCLSDDAWRQVRGKVEASFDSMGRQTLKNIAHPLEVWRWTADAAAADAPSPAGRLALPDKPSLAVLPFDNMSGDPEQAYFADGLAEDLITGLSRVSWLFVIARNSSFSLRGRQLDARTIGERLGVRYLVEGSVRRAGQRLRLTAQLIEAATGNHLWAERYDGSLEDVFDFQDRLVSSLVGAIEPKLRATEIARARRKRPDSLDAFDLYLQALPKMAVMSDQGFAEAIELLDRAIGLAPHYAQALAQGALCRVVRPVFGYSPDVDKDFREAAELSRRALENDPENPEALAATGMIVVLAHKDYQVGWDLVDRSLAIDLNSAAGWRSRGWISVWAGESESAVAEFAKAMRLSPHDLYGGQTKAGMALALLVGGRPEEALPWARKSLQDIPNSGSPLRVLIGALWLSGRHAEAREAAARYVGTYPGFSVRRWADNGPLRRTPDQELFVGALRAAGLPE